MQSNCEFIVKGVAVHTGGWVEQEQPRHRTNTACFETHAPDLAECFGTV